MPSDSAAYDFQVTVDAADPHALADWWAETLGWIVEPSDEALIRRMIAEGYATADDTTTHNGALVWRTGAAIRHPDGPERGPRKRVLFQLVPEAKTVKNRVHLDVWVGPDNVEAELERLVSRGATFLHRGRQGPQTWVTVADPKATSSACRSRPTNKTLSGLSAGRARHRSRLRRAPPRCSRRR